MADHTVKVTSIPQMLTDSILLKVVPWDLYGVRILFGSEINVLNDGSLSLEQKYIDRLDYEMLVKAAKELHVALEVNNSSLVNYSDFYKSE